MRPEIIDPETTFIRLSTDFKYDSDKTTKDVTKKWLDDNDVPFDILKMRPDNNQFKFMPDDDLKQNWLDSLFSNKDDIFAVFDDRQKVVDMWRSNGLNVFQVADGNF